MSLLGDFHFMIRYVFPLEKLVCPAEISVVRCKVPLCSPEWIYSAIWQVSKSPRQICNGKRAVQERMCVISKFIDQKMKSEESVSRAPFPFDGSPWREYGMVFLVFFYFGF